MNEVPIRAAGVVLFREEDGVKQTLAVHRPHRHDWSLPKGKLEPGEHVLAAAVRECDEETGITPTLGAPLARLQYLANGAPKIVDYWVANAAESVPFNPDDEIDEVRWIDVDAADELLTYPGDVELVRKAVGMPETLPFIILRHTNALKRSHFDGENDQLRPLSGKGRTQAKALVPLLASYGVTNIHSSLSLRCTETVRRYAKSLGRKVRTESAITEEDHRIQPKAAIRRVKLLFAKPKPTVVCTHRPVLPSVMRAVADSLGLDPDNELLDPKLSPGSFIVVHREFLSNGGIRAVAIERHDLAVEAE